MVNKDHQIIRLFRKFPILLAYQHGSSIDGRKGHLSDLDFAVLFKSSVKEEFFNLRLELLDRLGRIYPKERIDLAVLNQSSPLLNFLVIRKGKLLFCQDKKEKLKFIIKTFREYQDFAYLRKTYYHFLEKRIENGCLGEKLYDQ